MTDNLPVLPEFLNTTLPKGKYNRDYVINLCKIMNSHLQKYRLSRNCDLSFSMRESLTKLIAHLEFEKQDEENPDYNPMVLFTCKNCESQEVVPKSQLSIYICIICGN